ILIANKITSYTNVSFSDRTFFAQPHKIALLPGLKALREKKMELEQKRRIRINKFTNSKLSTNGNRK
ncbi:hypothetical protein, partial [Nostoc sp.]|uniref:hypothetical protein n=1 Tax=Nostoc sp. TaxID=1180 RepID=UPI002FFB8731